MDHKTVHEVIMTFADVYPLYEPYFSIVLANCSLPESNLPKTTCLPSNQGVGATVIKNWLPLVF